MFFPEKRMGGGGLWVFSGGKGKKGGVHGRHLSLEKKERRGGGLFFADPEKGAGGILGKGEKAWNFRKGEKKRYMVRSCAVRGGRKKKREKRPAVGG